MQGMEAGRLETAFWAKSGILPNVFPYLNAFSFSVNKTNKSAACRLNAYDGTQYLLLMSTVYSQVSFNVVQLHSIEDWKKWITACCGPCSCPEHTKSIYVSHRIVI